ncbi:KPN_02809 family neutral zinc metallopeptidase [Roseivivax isoporae]|uniref:Membrane protein n=1 Tax=Roseivivax isoporae LMG 25204 TaxID=1449351 RepID=X7FCS5_9RHOB|nr:neutral zinc metallopeptidase [Roseivivax isoporae]ETX29864.1 membrane protein [Roseivivax isoporae LMG 25204]
MRLRGVRRSVRVEDRRRGGGGGATRIGGVGLLIVLAIGYFAGIDVMPLIDDARGAAVPRELTRAEEQAGTFAARVLATTEEVWSEVLPDQVGIAYAPPILVLFAGVTPSPCGTASGATGPFYCPADEKAYLDTEFFAVLEQRLDAGGDLAAAYVIAHEVAHHIQNELGILGAVASRRAEVGEAEANALTVRLELQADCLAGIWAGRVRGMLDPGDLEEALNAARQIGDDTLQARAGRVPQPHTFTHGTSEQRARWFATGYRSGVIEDCDTFTVREP